MPVKVIELSNYDEWDAALPSGADIYARAGYVGAATIGKGVAVLLEARSAMASMVLPMVVRPIPTWLGFDNACDAESPYGYPGIYTTGNAEELTACWSEMLGAFRDLGVVNLFLRLNPLEDVSLPDALRTNVNRNTRYVPLDEGIANAFSGHECSTHRSQVRRAAALGITYDVTDAPDIAALEFFERLYNETMARVDADAEYFFPPEYYERLRTGCGPNLGLVSVRDASAEVVAQALVLAGPNYGHYHLSARTATAHNVSGHVQLDAAARWAAARGLRALHLGGGRTPLADDPLYRFKARVGRGVAAFQTAHVVVDSVRHTQIADRATSESGHRSNWFQSYRDPQHQRNS